MSVSQTHSEITLAVENPYEPQCVSLMEAHWEDLKARYGYEGDCRYLPADVAGKGSAFVVARWNSEPVGCGAIRFLEPGVAEINRVFVREEARRRGIARRLLETLERVAHERNYAVVRLETGLLQPEAMRLYETSGYARIPCFGEYAADPLSVCYEKKL